MYQNLDSFVTAFSDRGGGFRDPQLAATAPWFVNVAIQNGVGNESDDDYVYQMGMVFGGVRHS